VRDVGVRKMLEESVAESLCRRLSLCAGRLVYICDNRRERSPDWLRADTSFSCRLTFFLRP
jgi:hypothetical protein